MIFFFYKFGFGKCFGASSGSNHWTGRCQLLYETHLALHITIQSRNDSLLLCKIREDDTSKQRFILIFGQLMKYPLIKLFHLSNLLQMPNDHRMVDIEFLGNFSCRCKRISFADCSQLSLSASNGWPLHSSSSRLSSPLQNLIHPCTVCSLVFPGSNALLMLWVVSVALWPILNSNKKITWIYFLPNIIFLF